MQAVGLQAVSALEHVSSVLGLQSRVEVAEFACIEGSNHRRNDGRTASDMKAPFRLSAARLNTSPLQLVKRGTSIGSPTAFGSRVAPISAVCGRVIPLCCVSSEAAQHGPATSLAAGSCCAASETSESCRFGA